MIKKKMKTLKLGLSSNYIYDELGATDFGEFAGKVCVKNVGLALADQE